VWAALAGRAKNSDTVIRNAGIARRVEAEAIHIHRHVGRFS
jgi:hypothetical protein